MFACLFACFFQEILKSVMAKSGLISEAQIIAAVFYRQFLLGFN